MAVWKAPWRLVRLTAHLFGGLRRAGRFEALAPQQRHAEIGDWSAAMLRHIGVTHHVHGRPHAGATLTVANHVSWLDIAALHAAAPHARFVSKADVLRWPLIGPLVRASGSLFIERERKRDALRVVHEVAGALKSGDTVAVFPEGTTGPGHEVLPFHANLLQAAISAGGIVQPVALHYTQPGQTVSLAAQYIGDTTLMGSILRLACARQVEVHVHFLDPIVVDEAAGTTDRRTLSDLARERISGQLAVAIAAHEAVTAGR